MQICTLKCRDRLGDPGASGAGVSQGAGNRAVGAAANCCARFTAPVWKPPKGKTGLVFHTSLVTKIIQGNGSVQKRFSLVLTQQNIFSHPFPHQKKMGSEIPCHSKQCLIKQKIKIKLNFK